MVILFLSKLGDALYKVLSLLIALKLEVFFQVGQVLSLNNKLSFVLFRKVIDSLTTLEMMIALNSQILIFVFIRRFSSGRKLSYLQYPSHERLPSQ